MARKRVGETFEEVLGEFLRDKMESFYDGEGDMPKVEEVGIIRAFGVWVDSIGYRLIKVRVRKPKLSQE